MKSKFQSRKPFKSGFAAVLVFYFLLSPFYFASFAQANDAVMHDATGHVLSPLSGDHLDFPGDTTIGGENPQTASYKLTTLANAATPGIYYYSAIIGNWTPVTIGANLTFNNGVLTATGGGGGGGLVDGNFGDIVVSGTGTVVTIPGGAVAFSELSAKPSTLSGYGITDAQPLDSDLTSLAAASGTNTLYYRSGSGTWSQVTIGSNLTFSSGVLAATTGSGGTLSDGDKGDITVSSTGSVFTIDPGAVSLGKLANVTGPAFLGSVTAGSSAVSALSQAQMRTSLYGSFDGSFATLSSLPTTRAGYGITDAQPLSSNLTALAGASNTSFGRSLLGAADAPAALSLLSASAVGGNIFSLPNPNTLGFLRTAADNTVSVRTPSQTVSDLGIQASLDAKANLNTSNSFSGGLKPGADGSFGLGDSTHHWGNVWTIGLNGVTLNAASVAFLNNANASAWRTSLDLAQTSTVAFQTVTAIGGTIGASPPAASSSDSYFLAQPGAGHVGIQLLDDSGAIIFSVDPVTGGVFSAAPTTSTFAPSHVSENAQTGTSYTLVLGDDGKLVSMTNASSNTLTVPPNSSVAFPIGTRILIEQGGTATTTIAAGGGVTIQSRGSLYSLAGQYAGATLIKKATNTWLLIGDLQ